MKGKSFVVTALCDIAVFFLCSTIVKFAPKWVCLFVMDVGWGLMWRFCRDYLKLADKYDDYI